MKLYSACSVTRITFLTISLHYMSLHESIGKNMRVKEQLKCLWCDTVPNLHTLFKSMCKFKGIGSMNSNRNTHTH